MLAYTYRWNNSAGSRNGSSEVHLRGEGDAVNGMDEAETGRTQWQTLRKLPRRHGATVVRSHEIPKKGIQIEVSNNNYRWIVYIGKLKLT